ncbi:MULTISPECIES: DUF6436 domain-containing protein [unclassified Oceanobacter]|uniref:DUF6436 domain-containing protein n=1 Tax=unclassified Oceanobacter TaxID=2620260 RepID=UPI00273464BC|nr:MULTISPECIES: DUF6436 domain-containing protein [unclassified Oceanobacter]MDP2610582.1 DUF6436 domain-containing protein [Oceanobacter sp. 1_MG-2023]MDP2612661.1 DUF6436 domain-containing protein [Oceanobacter sp. 2_MG-2023]
MPSSIPPPPPSAAVSPTNNPNRQRNIVLGLVVVLWLSGTGLALWWFQSQTIRSFLAADSSPAALNTQALETTLAALLARLPTNPHVTQAPVTMVHFWNPDCLCNQVSRRHFDGLVSAFDRYQLRIVVVAAANATAEQLAEFHQLNGQRMELIQADDLTALIPSSPALALVKENGRLGYFGAYGFGALCSVASDDFFPNMVRQMTDGQYGPFINVAGSGCFCRWPTTSDALPSGAD